jgi:hypothetical protein
VTVSRTVGAAVQLIEQVKALSDDEVEVEAVGTPDGYGRNRSIQFDADTSEWLVPALEAIEDDRIADVDYEEGEEAVVTFVSDSRADRSDPYPLAEVLTVLIDEVLDEDEDDDEYEPIEDDDED